MPEYYEEIRPTLKTGDIILFSSHLSLFGRVIRIFTRSQWTHVGVVIRFNDPFDVVTLWEADQGVGCVYLTNLGSRVKQFRGDITVRHLKGIELSDSDIAALYNIREKFKYLKYERLPFIQLLRSALDYGWGFFGKNQVRDLSELFCSELVAETLQQLGLLSKELPSNEYVPGDFSEKNTNFKLLRGYYGPEIAIKTRKRRLGIF